MNNEQSDIVYIYIFLLAAAYMYIQRFLILGFEKFGRNWIDEARLKSSKKLLLAKYEVSNIPSLNEQIDQFRIIIEQTLKLYRLSNEQMHLLREAKNGKIDREYVNVYINELQSAPHKINYLEELNKGRLLRMKINGYDITFLGELVISNSVEEILDNIKNQKP